MHRREFLGGLAATGFGLPVVQRISKWWQLGPFNTERVVTLNSVTDIADPGLVSDIHQRIRADISMNENPQWDPKPKLRLLVSICERLAHYYNAPDECKSWAYRLVQRDELGGIAYKGIGLAHQFQGRHGIPSMDHNVDWWAFLIPGGFNFQALDDEPVHVIFAHVFGRDGVSTEVATWTATQRLIRRIESPARLANSGSQAGTDLLNKTWQTLNFASDDLR